MTCKECIHKSVCYRVDPVKSDYAQKCGDFVSDCKALEQEPCDDCISRQTVLNLFREHGEIYVTDIVALPPVMPAEKERDKDGKNEF